MLDNNKNNAERQEVLTDYYIGVDYANGKDITVYGKIKYSPPHKIILEMAIGDRGVDRQRMHD